MEGWPGGGWAHPLLPAVTVLQSFMCLSTHDSLCFPPGVKRGHSTSEMSCQHSPCVSPHISLKQDSLCPLPPPFLSFFLLLSVIIFQLEVGQELVLSLLARLWIYKLIDAGEYNAQATDVITALIKTITPAHGCHSWVGGDVILWQLLHLFPSGCTFVFCPSHGSITQRSYKWFSQPECTHVHVWIMHSCSRLITVLPYNQWDELLFCSLPSSSCTYTTPSHFFFSSLSKIITSRNLIHKYMEKISTPSLYKKKNIIHYRSLSGLPYHLRDMASPFLSPLHPLLDHTGLSLTLSCPIFTSAYLLHSSISAPGLLSRLSSFS